MKDKAILFDGSRCASCQACAVACKRRGQLPFHTEEGNEAPANAYQRAADLDGLTPLMIVLTERETTGSGLVWEAARKGCVRCFEAPCASVCPTGALVVDDAAGLVGPDSDRCVSCGLCSMVCPVAVPHHADGRAAVCLCDGCADIVTNGGAPACVRACPTGALSYGGREEVAAQARERAAVLRDRGYDRAAVLGESEQGGHFVLQVLKYGVEGHINEPFAETEEMPWIAGAKMAGPVSLAALGVLGAGAAVGLAVEANKARRERSEAVRVPVKAYEGVAVDVDVLGDDAVLADATGDNAEPGATAAAADGSAESALEAALRKREAARARAASTPAAAAAAAAAARGEGPQLIPVAFDEPVDEEDGDDWPIGVDGEEAAAVDEKENTGELYDLEEFNRLLKADILAHHAVKVASKKEEAGAAAVDSASEAAVPSPDDGEV
ncbi:4Fe-4S dicluster domain-containing protein [Adlercreutzia sp. R7]|uniref:4Fe-4S dicluster domain-containing protein n=1 Tax=Adlercreutzia wanghongyangiae TaxID=3111451 RepID=A0ABU6IIF7_9ACTN|nr:4Fe-4S dicluster domain-containing protein [Adlercreutzia sp. R7]